jgi:hypothetical protein
MACVRPLSELINTAEPAWPIVLDWAALATNRVEILPPQDDSAREKALLATQVTTRSPMGALVYESGGILVDHGWLRILGSGHPKLSRSLPEWNKNKVPSASGQPPPFYLVADDVVGGFFAIDGGGLETKPGQISYFAPDSLEWEPMEMTYSDFLNWAFQGAVSSYYADLRWPGWQEDVANVGGHQALSVMPFLSCSGPPIGERSRRAISIDEIYRLHVNANV